MKRFVFILFFGSITVFSQQEIEIIGVNYNYITSSNYSNDYYNSKTNKLDAFVNYGHDLGKKSKLFYHVSYQNFDFKTKINFEIPCGTGVYETKIPNYTLLTAATGMTNKIKNNLKLTNILAFTFVNNSKDDLLKTNNYFRTFSYLKKEESNAFSYGLGLYIDNVKDKIRVLPIISLTLENTKRGMKLFFPRSFKLWQKITKKSYVEFKTNIDSNTLFYNYYNNYRVNIRSITNDLTYNYIFKNKFKLKVGLGLPIREYKYNSIDFSTSQKPKLSFVAGFSYVVFQKN